MTDIHAITEKFAQTIKNTETYRKYLFEKERLEQYPELKNKIDEYRRKVFEIQMNSNPDTLYDELDKLEEWTDSFRKDETANDFLNAELALCRMMQEIYSELTINLDFDMDFTAFQK